MNALAAFAFLLAYGALAAFLIAGTLRMFRAFN